MRSVPSRMPNLAQSAHPRLVVEASYTTPARTGVLLVGRLEAGDVAPGQTLAAELAGDERLEVVVRAVDSVVGDHEGSRTVGLLLDPTDAERLVPGTVLTAPKARQGNSAVASHAIELRVSEVIKLSVEFPDSRARALVLAAASFLAVMSIAVFGLATVYVVTDQEARVPIIVSLIAAFFAAIPFTIARYFSHNYFFKHRRDLVADDPDWENHTRSSRRRE